MTLLRPERIIRRRSVAKNSRIGTRVVFAVRPRFCVNKQGVLRPPYGPRPNDANKRVWTDHYFVGAGLRVE